MIILDDGLNPCPICGAKAYIMHDIVDGFEFGWSAGCPRFKLDDEIHGMDENTPEWKYPRVMHHCTKQSAIEAWNRRASDVRISNHVVRNRPVDSAH